MQNINTSKLILKNLIENEDFTRRVIPYLRVKYFDEQSEKVVCKTIKDYYAKYKSKVDYGILAIELNNNTNLHENDYDSSVELLKELETLQNVTDKDWLETQAEEYCKERAIYLSIMESINIIDGKSKFSKGLIPEMLTEALSISFDTHIGHNFVDNAEERYDFYHKKEEKFEFDLEYMNKITNNGVSRKTLSVLLAATGVGKSLVMCHFAAAYMMAGYNVLYITLEMSEERIAERIDANLLNTPIDQIANIPKKNYISKISKIKAKTQGQLVVKEYPTSKANSLHFTALIKELKLKKKFVPDIIFIDYINIASSARIKGSVTNSYFYVKSIAEEFRGMAVETNTAIFTATQTNRDGYENSDVELSNTSESFGLPSTADLMWAVMQTEELAEMGQFLFKQLKNRYADLNRYKRFVVGVDKSKMKLYDLEESAQQNIHSEKGSKKKTDEDKPLMDTTGFGERWKEDDQMKWATRTKGRKDFSGIKV